MSELQMTANVEFRGDTLANWTAVNPIPRNRELVLETDTRKFKVGDGVTPYLSLPYVVGPTGPQGVIGLTGPTGAVSTVPGPTGAIGVTGVVGPTGPSTALTVNAQVGTTYTLVAGDASNTFISMTNASANTLTLPPNATVSIAVGSIVMVYQGGAGKTTIAPGAAVIINKSAAASAARAQYSVIVCTKVATDSWVVSGDIF